MAPARWLSRQEITCVSSLPIFLAHSLRLELRQHFRCTNLIICKKASFIFSYSLHFCFDILFPWDFFAKVSPEVIGHFNATRTARGCAENSLQTEMPNSGQTGLCRSRSPSTEDQIGRHLGLELIQLDRISDFQLKIL